jgi:pimeloyl-ACP methyl ester carboxylesterase
VYSPDTPGCGESDAPPKALNIAGYAESIGDFIDSMRFRSIDLLGAHSGAAVAAELAIARPKLVRRIVMIGAPVLDESERKTWRDLSPPEGLSPGALWARAAVIDWKAETRLPLIKQALLVLRPKDNFWEGGGRVSKYVAGAKVVDMPDQDKRVLETQASLVAKHVVPFLA